MEKSGDKPSNNTTAGVDNKGFDVEKGDVKEDKWVKNYVPYDDYPAGETAPAAATDSDSGEEKRRVEEKGEKGQDEEKWKENYVPYEETKSEE